MGSVNLKYIFKLNIYLTALLKAPDFHLLECNRASPLNNLFCIIL